MLSRRGLLQWLLDVEEDDRHPDRQATLRNGAELASLAAAEGMIAADPQQRDQFARTLAQLQADGWIAWDQVGWVSHPDPSPPHPTLFTDRDLHKAGVIRLLPAGVGAARRGASSEQRLQRPRLEPEQGELLGRLVGAARSVESSRRMFTLASRPPHGDFITGAGLERPVLRTDVQALQRCDVIRPLMEWDGGMQFVITPLGFTLIDDRADREPVARLEATIVGYLDSRAFASAYPLALQRWKEAAELLWSSSVAAELTTIGHKLREAVQEFATALVEGFGIADADPNPAHTVTRLTAVIARTAKHQSRAARRVLDALVTYWGEVNDLLQRQEHGAQKEGEPLETEDARRAVFHTALVMYEIDRLVGRPGPD